MYLFSPPALLLSRAGTGRRDFREGWKQKGMEISIKTNLWLSLLPTFFLLLVFFLFFPALDRVATGGVLLLLFFCKKGTILY